ncbi:helix-turn-helix domain-containing protein [Nocardia sp. NPDC047654]|uniref:helix-turn-helix domain-containing protein n=1 Tax=Nocardia sp. NPDC047654 TaxID=3364314 RepID=UPI00371A4331
MSTHETVDPLADIRSSATTSIARAAELLGIGRASAYRMAKDGRLPVVPLGPHRYRVKSAGLLAMLQTDPGSAA